MPVLLHFGDKFLTLCCPVFPHQNVVQQVLSGMGDVGRNARVNTRASVGIHFPYNAFLLSVVSRLVSRMPRYVPSSYHQKPFSYCSKLCGRFHTVRFHYGMLK